MWYAIEKMLHLLLDDNDAINMVNVARRYGEVHLFVVQEKGEVEVHVCEVQVEAEQVQCEAAEVDVHEEVVEVEAHAEVEFEDANGLNRDSVEGLGVVDVDLNVASDVEVEGDIEVEAMSESDDSSRGKFENIAHHLTKLSDDEWHSKELLNGPDSESETTRDEENNDERTGCGPFQTFVMPKSMADYKWEVGTVFLYNNHFKDAIRTYAIHAGRNLKFLKNDSKRVKVGCLGAQNKCQWSAYCSNVPSRKI